MHKYTELLGTAPLGRLLIKLSLPGMAATISTSLYNIVNTIWVTRIGYQAIAALTIVMPFQILSYAIGGGTGIGIAALVSRRFGEKNPDAANHAAGQIFCISAAWGLLFILIAVLFADEILPILGSRPDIFDYSKQYLVITAFGSPQMIFSLVTASLIRGSGDAVKPMIIMISSTVLNIVLDPLLIFGIGPLPEMGVSGAALGTVIAQTFGASLGLYYFLAGKTAYRIKFAHLRPDMSILKDIYRVGAPTMISQLMESLVFLLFNKVVSSFGSLVIATIGIVMRISDFAFMPVMGVSNGMLPIVGYNFGARNFKRLWHTVKLASGGIMVFLAIITILMVVFAPQIVSVFTRDPALSTEAVPVMRIMLSTMLFVGPTMMFITAFQGLSRGTLALFLSLLRQFLFFLPVLFLFRYLFGLYGVWWSMPASDILSFALTFVFIFREYRKEGKTIAGMAVVTGTAKDIKRD
jgi:putative MATE family efflux protein